MVVYHVDEGVTFTNKANADEAHRLVDLVEADGSLATNTYGYPGSAADVFPGSSGHVDFTDADRRRRRRCTPARPPAPRCTSTAAAPTR